jgi:hypothetical protein
MRVVLAPGAWLLMTLVACQSAAPIAVDTAPGGTPTLGGVPVATGTPALGIDLRVPPTRAPRPSSATTGPAASPSGVVSASLSASATVTLAEDGRTITLLPGQYALVNLGSELDWTVHVHDETIVSRVAGITVVRGAQGIYQANRVGQTVLSATGDPACRKAQPACAQVSRTFTVTIIVR